MGDSCLNSYDKLIDRFTSWASFSNSVNAVFIIGSRARIDYPADEYSDLDLIMVVSDPEHFLLENQWLEAMGNYWISFVESTVGGGKERRVLFENALDVDFLLFSEELFKQAIAQNEVKELFKRGYRVLLDKNGVANVLSQVPAEHCLYLPPAANEFLNVVNDFWYHSVWAAKKLQRGELWMAKSCVDCYMKRLLVKMIEWHAHVIFGWDYDTWHEGRFLDRWADPSVKKELSAVFAHYEISDIGRALLATMNLFHRLAVEVSRKMDFKYPYDEYKNAANWVMKSLAGLKA